MLSVQQDKKRIQTQLRVNLMNFPDDSDAVDALLPQLRAQASSIVKLISADDLTPAELMALMSLIGPVLARTPVFGVPKRAKRLPVRRNDLRAV